MGTGSPPLLCLQCSCVEGEKGELLYPARTWSWLGLASGSLQFMQDGRKQTPKAGEKGEGRQ